MIEVYKIKSFFIIGNGFDWERIIGFEVDSCSVWWARNVEIKRELDFGTAMVAMSCWRGKLGFNGNGRDEEEEEEDENGEDWDFHR